MIQIILYIKKCVHKYFYKFEKYARFIFLSFILIIYAIYYIYTFITNSFMIYVISKHELVFFIFLAVKFLYTSNELNPEHF